MLLQWFGGFLEQSQIQTSGLNSSISCFVMHCLVERALLCLMLEKINVNFFGMRFDIRVDLLLACSILTPYEIFLSKLLI